MTDERRIGRPAAPRDHWLTDPLADSAGATGTSLRVRSLAETEAVARQWLEPCGITRIADVTDLDRVGIPVFHSVRPAAAPGLNTVTSGKGTTVAAARVSAMMEAIERSWCEPYDDVPPVASYAELTERGTAALDPRRLMLRRSHTWSEEAPIGWWPARELVGGSEVLVPALAVLTPYAHEHGMFSSNTIGLAVGNSPQEALLHGLLELVEHDCAAFGEVLKQAWSVPVESLPPGPTALVERFAAAGVEVRVFLYLTDTGIPTVHVTTEDTHAQDGMLFNGGAGCHLDPEVALTRALTEAAQSRLNVIAGAREDFDQQAYRRHTSYEQLRDRYASWASGRDQMDFDQIRAASTGTTAGDLERVVEALFGIGARTILATELAPSRLPFSVTKVIVPGLEVFHEDRERIGPRMHRALTRLGLAGALS
ncbi:YcaO-like family protein [Micromonospora sp. CPCC 205561]|uniref:YcaO-like family protein n=1 Tax=Micromonospora sp. CPCC 205561 TaxID=3122407 RepID=UPI002FF0DFEF